MTGFGEARIQDEQRSVLVEIRAVNNRHFKLTTRIGESYAALESDIERLLRDVVRRGTVHVSLRVDRPRREEDFRINRVALTSYLKQLREIPGVERVDVGSLVNLPGVVEDRSTVREDPHDEWPVLEPAFKQAIEKLQAARAEEGRAMAAQLIDLIGSIEAELKAVEERCPTVVESFQSRLRERLERTLREHQVAVESKDLIREVAIFADRSDVTEEIVRLKAHLSQFVETIHDKESGGRKLEFLAQEMGRETNTMGSKAGDVEISRRVVGIKGALEKIREIILNIE